MPGDVGPYQAQWNLRPRIDAIRAEAKAAREQNIEHYKTQETDLAITRDRLAREEYGLEQQAKSADIQVGVETKEVQRLTDGIAKREAGMAAAEKRGDTAKVQEDREDIAAWKAVLSTHEARARQATLDAAELREQAAGVTRQRSDLTVERDDLQRQNVKIEAEIDKMEQQADGLQQARMKYAEADLSDDTMKRSALELEAEALVTKAGAIEVDRALIRTVVPDLPATTPGIDADPGPLPPGADDGSGSTDDTDLMDPNDEDGTPGRSNDTDLMDPNDLSDASTEDGSDDLALTISGSGVGGEQISGDQRIALAAAEAYQPTNPAEFEPINAAASGSESVADISEYNTPQYEAPAYEEPTYNDPAGSTEDSYSSQSDFSASADTDGGFAEPSYETESFEV